jgi:hypothetical protein
MHKISVCLVCIHLLANGEFNDGTDAAEVCAAGIEREWAGYRLIPGSEEEGYSSRPCGGCGDVMHGDRFEAWAENVRGTD